MADLYTTYCNYLKNEEFKSPEDRYVGFKNTEAYTYMLEHVTENLGGQYLRLIFSEFEVSEEDVVNYITTNDSFGNPIKSTYITPDGNTIACSPNSLRYAYQALVILKYYRSSECENMVELGCGYGGLFMAIDYFANILNINIVKYHMVDVPEPNNLINFYLNLHKDTVKLSYELHEAANYGTTVPSGKLFFISNYCYTEIDTIHKERYYSNLIKRTDNGFIIWQSSTFDIEYMNQMFKDPSNVQVVVERPQTCFNVSTPNYFVMF
jgi:mRNA-degrading endonuclease HigB of HigAB toxin-antitoxin module